jgi:hypothetical protein
MKSRSAAHFAAVAAMANALLLPLSPSAAFQDTSASARMSTPAGWRREASPGLIHGAGTYTVALPSELKTVPVEGIESYVSEYRSKSLRLVFDFGAYGRSGVEECRRHRSSCSIGTIAIDGMRAARVTYYADDPDGGLPYRAGYTILFGPPPTPPRQRISLTISAECATARACALAARIVRTIDILPDR